MKAVLTFKDPAGNTQKVDTGDRKPVVHGITDIIEGVRTFDLPDNRPRDLSLYFANNDVDDDNGIALTLALMADVTTVQSQVVYPDRAYLIPVPPSITSIVVTNDGFETVTINISVF